MCSSLFHRKKSYSLLLHNNLSRNKTMYKIRHFAFHKILDDLAVRLSHTILYSMTLLYDCCILFYIQWPCCTPFAYYSILNDLAVRLSHTILYSMTLLYACRILFYIYWPCCTPVAYYSIFNDLDVRLSHTILYSMTLFYDCRILFYTQWPCCTPVSYYSIHLAVTWARATTVGIRTLFSDILRCTWVLWPGPVQQQLISVHCSLTY